MARTSKPKPAPEPKAKPGPGLHDLDNARLEGDVLVVGQRLAILDSRGPDLLGGRPCRIDPDAPMRIRRVPLSEIDAALEGIARWEERRPKAVHPRRQEWESLRDRAAALR